MTADDQGQAPASVPGRDLAVRVLEFYWPQVRPYARRDGAPLLKQSSRPKAVTVDAVRALREMAAAAGAHSPAAAERALPAAYAQTISVIELNLVQMPLGKLQRPSGYSASGAADYPRFLYDDAPFHESVTTRQLRTRPLDVVLKPNVGDWLVSLGGLLRPLVELHWTRAVATFSNEQLPAEHLRNFLFGTDRIALRAVEPGLRQAQAGLCFYCRRQLPAGEVKVDHFVPWSRLPNDALGNLVLADRRCNNGKRDHYADLELLARWAGRPEKVLTQVAHAAAWPLQLSRSRQVARGLYAHLPEGSALWQEPGVYTVLDRARLLDVLPMLEAT
ncbi:MAG: HNH endonuclease domain-containing protein [Mycobacteriales bacterium]